MNRAGAILAARQGRAVFFADAWSRLIERLGGRSSEELADPLIAVFSTPEQAMLACMTLLDSPPIALRGLGGVGLHIDQLSPNGGAPSFGGRSIAVALSDQAEPGTACLSLAMRNLLAGKLESGFGPVEDLPRPDAEPPLSFVRMHGLGAPSAVMGGVTSSKPAPRAVPISTDPTVVVAGPDVLEAPVDDARDATVVMATAPGENNPPPGSNSRLDAPG